MNHNELITALQDLGYAGDSTMLSRVINEANRRLSRERAWSWNKKELTVTCTPGQTEYTWTNFGVGSTPPRRTLSARLIDITVSPAEVYPLYWKDYEDFASYRGDLSISWPVSERDVPQWWTKFNGATVAASGISIWYPPDLPYKIHLTVVNNAVTLSGTDVPNMPTDYHDAIVYEAAWILASRQRDQVMMSEMRAERDAVLAGAEAEDSVQQIGDYERIRSV